MTDPPVSKVATWIPITDEMVVDFGFGTKAEQRAAAERIDQRNREIRAAWFALPWWTRAAWRVRQRRDDWRRRFDHAAAALRGIECERD